MGQRARRYRCRCDWCNCSSRDRSVDRFEAKMVKEELSTTGLFDRLTPEQVEQALSYRGPEAFGDQSLPKVPR